MACEYHDEGCAHFESDGQVMVIFVEDIPVWKQGERTLSIMIGNYLHGPTLADERSPKDQRVHTVYQITAKQLGAVIAAMDRMSIGDVAEAAKAIALVTPEPAEVE